MQNNLLFMTAPLRADISHPHANDTSINGFNMLSTAWLFSLIGQVHDTGAQALPEVVCASEVRPEANANLVDGIVGQPRAD
jgi:hypothetical protein